MAFQFGAVHKETLCKAANDGSWAERIMKKQEWSVGIIKDRDGYRYSMEGKIKSEGR